MSEENNKVLKQIASSLKSIDERLGLLLTSTKLKLEGTTGIGRSRSTRHLVGPLELLSAQNEFTKEIEDNLSYAEHDIEMLNEEFEQCGKDWKENLGLDINPHQLDDLDPEELAQCDTGLTFCDLANRFKDCGLPINRSQRYEWMRREFRKLQKTLPGKSPYNQFLAGKTSPSLIKIDYYTASQLVHIINQLLLSGKLKIPKEST